MQFNVEWLKKWVAIDLDADELADRLTAAGLEVDDVRPVAGEFTDVVVAEIEDCDKHPDADKLQVCTVNDGGAERLQVVCGAPNARPGIRVPLARVGATIGPEFRIKKAKLRGVESFGMLCSARELGLSDDHSGLMELPEDAPPGVALREYLGLDDRVIEVDLTPNRADCLSVRGIARDVAASCDAEFLDDEIQAVPALNEARFPIRLESPEDCPRYVGRIVRGIDPTAETPFWMAETLRRCGLRSISPTVDVTNFVLLELGQPMHAFDLDKLDGEIVVRRGREGEKLVLLDESEAELGDDILAICDSRGPVAIAGVMGGLDSGVTGETRDILFESAYFNPATIMGKARNLGMHTDASHRFERGVDPAGQEAAVERATALLTEIAGGEPGPLLVAEDKAYVPVNPAVTLRPGRLNRVIGCDIPAEMVENILVRLGMDVDWDGEKWTVIAPSARFDIAIEEDLIEEIARIYGYDEIPEAPVSGEHAPGTSRSHRVSLGRVRESLCAAGYQETINYSFVDHRDLEYLHHDHMVLPLANPLSSDLDVMRTTLMPGLLNSLSRNLRRQQSRVRLYEAGVAFLQGEVMNEVERIAAVASGDVLPEQWGVSSREMDFYDIKGNVEQLFAMKGIAGSPDFEAGALPWMHPGASAIVKVDGKAVGWCGALHPEVLKQFDIKKNVFAFEIDLEPLLSREVPFAKEISRFPSVRRDIAVLMPDNVTFAEVEKRIRSGAGPYLERVIIFDVYAGENLKDGYKSLAIGLIFNNVSSTLRDEDVDPAIQGVVSELEHHLGAQLRG
ncbi:MAG: phenylalanine--tRNA ligase subunit beta [Xanthomonadales bacterium]|jgi:phenylalanyl-tRNA synthetase beta chain|nr:phenylalanine--tRNA ligase subunit beta [Xanthomonadales bacterium]